MIWIKTEAGRAEMQARAIVKERLQRNLLLLIDGIKSEEMLLTHVSGLRHEDFAFLQSLDLIAPLPPSSPGRPAAALRGDEPTQPMSLPPTADGPPEEEPDAADAAEAQAEPPAMDYRRFTATLTRLISSELGLRGFTLTLAVEKAATIEELRAVARRVLEQIRDRKGEAVAERARQALFGD